MAHVKVHASEIEKGFERSQKERRAREREASRRAKKVETTVGELEDLFAEVGAVDEEVGRLLGDAEGLMARRLTLVEKFVKRCAG